MARHRKRRRHRLSRRRNPGYAYYNRRRRRHRYNPVASLRGITGSIGKGFSLPAITRAGTLAAGAVGSGMISGLIGSQVLSRVAPSMGANKYVGYAVGLGSAGLLGAVAGRFAPRYAGDLMTGGILKVVVDAVGDFLPAAYRPFGDFLTQSGALDARQLSDFLTQAGAAQARNLDGIEGMAL